MREHGRPIRRRPTPQPRKPGVPVGRIILGVAVVLQLALIAYVVILLFSFRGP